MDHFIEGFAYSFVKIWKDVSSIPVDLFLLGETMGYVLMGIVTIVVVLILMAKTPY